MRKVALISIFFALFFLSSCIFPAEIQSNLEKTDVISQAPVDDNLTKIEADDILSNDDDLDLNSFSVSFRPSRSYYPELTVSFTLIDELPSEFYYTYTYLCTVSQAEEVLQFFEITKYEILKPYMIWFKDIDFDGHLDMEIASLSATGNWPFDYYRYDVESGLFEETPIFSTWGRGVALDPYTKQVIVSIIDGASIVAREIYQYADGEYTLVLYEHEE